MALTESDTNQLNSAWYKLCVRNGLRRTSANLGDLINSGSGTTTNTELSNTTTHLYVDTVNGFNSNPGTEEAPYQSLEYAVNNLPYTSFKSANLVFHLTADPANFQQFLSLGNVNKITMDEASTLQVVGTPMVMGEVVLSGVNALAPVVPGYTAYSITSITLPEVLIGAGILLTKAEILPWNKMYPILESKSTLEVDGTIYIGGEDSPNAGADTYSFVALPVVTFGSNKPVNLSFGRVALYGDIKEDASLQANSCLIGGVLFNNVSYRSSFTRCSSYSGGLIINNSSFGYINDCCFINSTIKMDNSKCDPTTILNLVNSTLTLVNSNLPDIDGRAIIHTTDGSTISLTDGSCLSASVDVCDGTTSIIQSKRNSVVSLYGISATGTLQLEATTGSAIYLDTIQNDFTASVDGLAAQSKVDYSAPQNAPSGAQNPTASSLLGLKYGSRIAG